MIKLDNIVATYTTQRGQVNAVDGVSLEIPDSIIMGIAGESGCGKSTLMKVIYGDLGFPLELTSGSIDYGYQNRDMQDVTTENIRKESFPPVRQRTRAGPRATNPAPHRPAPTECLP